DHQRGQVVPVLGDVSHGGLEEVVEQALLLQMRSGGHQPEETVVAERLAVTSPRLDEAIGVEDQAVARLQAQDALLVLCLLQRAQRQPWDADELWLAVSRPVDRRALPRVREGQRAVLQIESAVNQT